MTRLRRIALILAATFFAAAVWGSAYEHVRFINILFGVMTLGPPP